MSRHLARGALDNAQQRLAALEQKLMALSAEHAVADNPCRMWGGPSRGRGSDGDELERERETEGVVHPNFYRSRGGGAVSYERGTPLGCGGDRPGGEVVTEMRDRKSVV